MNEVVIRVGETAVLTVQYPYLDFTRVDIVYRKVRYILTSTATSVKFIAVRGHVGPIRTVDDEGVEKTSLIYVTLSITLSIYSKHKKNTKNTTNT